MVLVPLSENHSSAHQAGHRWTWASNILPGALLLRRRKRERLRAPVRSAIASREIDARPTERVAEAPELEK